MKRSVQGLTGSQTRRARRQRCGWTVGVRRCWRGMLVGLGLMLRCQRLTKSAVQLLWRLTGAAPYSMGRNKGLRLR